MNVKKIFKKNSMASKILLTLLALVALQGAVFLAMLFGGNLQQEIKDSAFASFNDKIETRKNAFEHALTFKVYNPELYAELLNSCEQLRQNVTSIEQLKVSTDIAQSLKRLLHNTTASGAFIIFENGDNLHSGLSIRDTEPNNVSINDGDLLAEFGSSELIKEIGLTMDFHWKANIELQPEDSNDAYYFIPKAAAEQDPDANMMDLAYWSKPYYITEDDDQLISFSFPIMDESQNVYGVAGIQYSMSYLKSLLPYEEISGGEGAYILAFQNSDNLEYEPLLVSGPMYSDLTTSFNLQMSEKDENIYSLAATDRNQTDATVQKISLYNQSSPFKKDTWVLIGIVPERILLSALQEILRTLFITIAATVVIGILATILISIYFSKPFVILLRNLNHADPNKPLTLPKVKIDELDRMSNLVESMSHSIFESSSRLSNIIQLMDLPLGAIEIDRETQKIFCTGKIAELLDFTIENTAKDYLTTAEFECEIEDFKKNIIRAEREDSETNESYLVQIKQEEEPAWIRFSVMRLDKKTLVAISDVTKETLEKQKLEYERNYDILTNLLNRRAFHEEFDHIIKQQDIGVSALILWDLDNLKYINDTYGHDFGDLYIKEASNVFASLSSEHAITSRMAGDEFLVFLHGMKSREELLLVARRLHTSMMKQELNLLDNDKIRIRSSAGIAWYPEDGSVYEDLLKHADYAMYSAKHSLKGSMELFNYENFKNEYLLFETLEDLNQIIDEKLYRFAFQPIVDAVSGEVFGYEALLRPEGKTIRSPLDLIRIARSQSKLQIIERISFTGALEEYEHQKEAFKDARLFVNSIPKIVWRKKVIQEIQERFHDVLDKLVIEIIESDQLTADNLRLKKDTIESWNAAIALDDFGSGYNNDTAILSIHPHYLKIDQELIHNIHIDERRQMIVRNLIQYSKSQNIRIIGEGVETFSEMEFLIQEGIDYLQGYYLARPAFEVKDIPASRKKEIRQLHKKK